MALSQFCRQRVQHPGRGHEGREMVRVRFLDFAAFGGFARNDRGSLPLLEMTLGKGHATRASQ